MRRQSDNDYGEIYAALQTVTQNAKTYFAQCGNSIVQPKDEDAFVAEILYMYFNRRSCVEDPFQSRLNRVVVDAMAAKGELSASIQSRRSGHPTLWPLAALT